MTGMELIAVERERQVAEEDWTAEHDDEHDGQELAMAACAYAWPGASVLNNGRALPRELLWPWSDGWKPSGDRTRELVKAGALIAAEIDRLQRA